MKDLSFSLILKRHPVTLTDREGAKEYYLEEMSGTDRNAYLKKLGGKMNYDLRGKPIGLKSLDGLQGPLVALCLHDAQTEALIPLSRIDKFPAGVVDKLFHAAESMSSLTEDPSESGND